MWRINKERLVEATSASTNYLIRHNAGCRAKMSSSEQQCNNTTTQYPFHTTVCTRIGYSGHRMTSNNATSWYQPTANINTRKKYIDSQPVAPLQSDSPIVAYAAAWMLVPDHYEESEQQPATPSPRHLNCCIVSTALYPEYPSARHTYCVCGISIVELLDCCPFCITLCGHGRSRGRRPNDCSSSV